MYVSVGFLLPAEWDIRRNKKETSSWKIHKSFSIHCFIFHATTEQGVCPAIKGSLICIRREEAKLCHYYEKGVGWNVRCYVQKKVSFICQEYNNVKWRKWNGNGVSEREEVSKNKTFEKEEDSRETQFLKRRMCEKCSSSYHLILYIYIGMPLHLSSFGS
jgi:hypothetical protein